MAEWDRRFREAHDYAGVIGSSTGFPNFHQADYGDGLLYGTHFLGANAVEWRDVPRSDYQNAAIDNVPEMIRRATDYGSGQAGFIAALPNFHQADYGQGVVYGTFLIKGAAAEWQDVPRSELGTYAIDDVPGMMTAAHDWAVDHGFGAGYPTFYEADYGNGVVCGVVLIHAPYVSWRDVPASLLRLYSDPPRPWAIVLCHLSDVPPAANTRQRWEDFFLPGGSDPSNAARYFSDVSYGVFDAAGTHVFGPFDIGHSSAELATFRGGAQRQQIANWGSITAIANGVPLWLYPYRIVGLTSNADHGATGGMAVLAYVDGRPFEPTFMCHEMGHVLGLDHSFGDQPSACASGDNRPGAYCDVFDLMSAGNVRGYADVNGRTTGPRLAAPNLVQMGWLHPSRVLRVTTVVRTQEITLAALNRPDVDAPLALLLGGWWIFDTRFYLELRLDTGWDQGLNEDVVLIHSVADGLTRLRTSLGAGGRLLPGQEVVLPGLFSIVVRVVSIDAAAGTAVIRFWPLLAPGPRTVRVAHIDFNPPGSDVARENALIRNDTNAGVDMAGWTIADVAAHVFTFPSFVLASGAEVRVWTGTGTNDAANLYWGRRAAVWNNTGDTATVRRPDGTVASTYSYGAP